MFKKLLVATAVLAASSTVAMATLNSAPAPYLGASVGLTNNSTNTWWANNYRGVTGNLAAGYGGIVSPNFYLGGELFAVPGSLSVSGSNTTKTSWGVGASIIPGVMFSDKTMGYARLGAIESRFTSPGSAKLGGQVGLGIQTNLCQNWDLRGEYVWTKYPTVKYITAPTTDAVNLGVVYKFD